MRAHHALVHGLLSKGMGLRVIARHLTEGGIPSSSMRAPPMRQDMVTGRSSRPSRLDMYQPYLQRCIDETNGTITIIELREGLQPEHLDDFVSVRRNSGTGARPLVIAGCG